jgi:hemoglobin
MTDPPAAGTSLYRRLGGHEPLAAIVDVFSRRALADTTLAPAFVGVDPETLRRRQVALLVTILDGPVANPRPPIDPADLGLGPAGAEPRRVVRHLTAALHACGVPEALTVEVLERVTALHGPLTETERERTCYG